MRCSNARETARVEIKRREVVGSATVEAMQSGCITVCRLVDGILKRMIDEVGGTPHVIATGGWPR